MNSSLRALESINFHRQPGIGCPFDQSTIVNGNILHTKQ